MTFQPYQEMQEDGLPDATSDQAAPEPSAALLQCVMAAFRRRRTHTAHRRAITVRPSPRICAPVALGRRGAPQEEQFLYTVDGYDIDLHCSYDPALQSFVLQGQILAHSPDVTTDMGTDVDMLEGLEVRLIAKQTPADHRGERLRLTDALGQFTFSYVTAGEYTLTLLLAEEELLLEGIVAKHQPANHL